MTKTRSVLCDVCGRDMVDENDCEVVGMSLIVVDNREVMEHPEIARLRDTFGKTSFKICYVCWVKSLGIKPIGGDKK